MNFILKNILILVLDEKQVTFKYLLQYYCFNQSQNY